MNYNIIILILLILICLYFLTYNESFMNYETIHFKCGYDHPILSNDTLSDLQDLLLEFKRYTAEKHIPYFAIAGTLIGTVRQGGLMPLDDDIDMGILEKEYMKFENYTHEDFYIRHVFFGYKLFKKKYKGTSKIFIDIMIFRERDGMLKIQGTTMWESESLHYDEIFPLVTAKYSDIEITIPNKHIQYLHRAFPKWDTSMRPSCWHENDEKGICTYKDVLHLPDEFPFDEHNKYRCYSEFPTTTDV